MSVVRALEFMVHGIALSDPDRLRNPRYADELSSAGALPGLARLLSLAKGTESPSPPFAPYLDARGRD